MIEPFIAVFILVVVGLLLDKFWKI